MSINLTKNFEPSVETRRKQLYTFKYSDTIGMFPQPGLIQTSNTTAIIFWTIIALILSGIALILMKKYAGASLNLLYLSIFLDVLIAALSHWNQDKVCVLTNQNLVIEETQKGNSLSSITKAKRAKNFGTIFIWILAGFQIYFMVDAIKFLSITFNTAHIIIIVCFLISAYLHSKFTGYTFGYIIYKYSLNKDIKNHIKSGCLTNSFDPNKPKKYVLQTGVVKLKDCEYRGHEVKKEGENFVLITRGILEDIDELV